MVRVVAPVLQRLPVAALEVNTVVRPTQMALLPVIVGELGSGITVTATALETALVQLIEITRTE